MDFYLAENAKGSIVGPQHPKINGKNFYIQFSDTKRFVNFFFFFFFHNYGSDLLWLMHNKTVFNCD